MEVFIGYVAWILVGALLHIYFRYLKTTGPANRPFEAWSAEKPMLAALYSEDPTSERTAAALEKALNGGLGGINHHGLHPWPHYRLRLRVVALSNQVLGIYLGEAELQRGSREPLSFFPALRRALGNLGLAGSKVWLLGNAFGGGVNQPEHWTGQVGMGGELNLSAAQNEPLWLLPSLRARGELEV